MQAKLRTASGWEVDLGYFQRKPRFRPGYKPYTDEKCDVVDENNSVIAKARINPATGVVEGLPDDVQQAPLRGA